MKLDSRKFLVRSLAILVPALLAATSAAAQSNAESLISNSFVFNAGAFIVGTDVRAKVNGQSVSNPEVDFDDTFGTASDSTRARIDALWRINPNHHLRFLYFNNSTTRNKVLDRDVAWGDEVFHVGANVESQVKIKIYELAYEYAFIHQPTYEFAGSFGVHYSDLSLRLAGNATTGGGQTASFVSDTRTLPAPLPVLGLRAGWAFAPDWYVEGLGQLFKVKIDGYDGHWVDARAGVTYMFSRNFGLGLGYNRFVTRVDVERSNFNGSARFGYSGLQAYLTGTF